MGIRFKFGQPYIYTDYQQLVIGIVEVADVVIDGIRNFEPENNNFSLSYTKYQRVISDTNTEHLFREGLAPEHPGVVLLKPEHLVELDKAIAKYRIDEPEASPAFAKALRQGDEGYDMNNPDTWFEEGVTDADANLAELLRFQYWIAWALENCEMPACLNS